MDHHGGPEPLPPGTGVTFTGALDRCGGGSQGPQASGFDNPDGSSVGSVGAGTCTLPTGPDVPVGFEGERGRLGEVRAGALARLHVPSGDLQPVSSSGSRQEHLSLGGGSFVQQTELRPGDSLVEVRDGGN